MAVWDKKSNLKDEGSGAGWLLTTYVIRSKLSLLSSLQERAAQSPKSAPGCRWFSAAIPNSTRPGPSSLGLLSPFLQRISGLLQTEGYSFCDLASLTFLCIS